MTELIFTLSVFLIPLGMALAGVLKIHKQPFKLSENTSSFILLAPSILGFAISALLYSQGFSLSTEIITIDPVRLTLISLILFLTGVLIKFSHNYMLTDEHKVKFYKHTFFTVASVLAFAILNHTLLLWFSWLLISLNLHHLLLHYPDRPRAQLAAHKKFIFARIAEFFLLSAILILFQTHHTFNLTALWNFYQGDVQLSSIEHLAAIFIGIAALIKCAQLPFHGWLIQVVEAPTPVSALLHAGVINLGGVLILFFSSLVLNSTIALWLILAIASTTTVLAALVMKTRVSYKVNLAWSTSAQMGLMLVECALGAWDIFLLHLISHSLYKAYAFLNSGEAVQQFVLNKKFGTKQIKILPNIIGLLVSLGLIFTAHQLIGLKGSLSLWLLFGLGISLLIAQQIEDSILSKLPKAIFSGALILSLYIGFKQMIQLVSSDIEIVPVAQFQFDYFFATAILSLFIIDRLLAIPSFHKINLIVDRWLYSGFYVDEFFTSLTFKVWPVRLQKEVPQELNPTFEPSIVKES